ncbi:hypothetical protein Axy23_010 [Achromobacter phage vB_AxyP_19-32_Axy23]|uniref:Uncharacterized protein n=1 Tax=Achromobacter phage vB_AxyP_19-32_Axy23 TaxID=2591047 RepID=A0A514CW40_9CAUD|nr:hypothetical protein Axy23_010 [Achromobacter phage vB_AxyP_19-32_Axy23]
MSSGRPNGDRTPKALAAWAVSQAVALIAELDPAQEDAERPAQRVHTLDCRRQWDPDHAGLVFTVTALLTENGPAVKVAGAYLPSVLDAVAARCLLQGYHLGDLPEQIKRTQL